jgi:hypothetical protein
MILISYNIQGGTVMADKVDFRHDRSLQSASQIKKWVDIYSTLNDAGRVFGGEDGKKITIEKSAGLIGIEFPYGGFSGERTILKGYPRSLPPQNGVHGTVIVEPGCDYGKTAFFFDLSNPQVSSGDSNQLQFKTSYCGGDGTESGITVAVK